MPFPAVRSARLVLISAGLLVLTSACRSSQPEAASGSDAAASDAGSPVESGAADAGLAAVDPGPESLTATITAVGGERTVELQPGELTEDVPAESRIEIVLPRLSDVRVRLFDEADKMVPSNDSLAHSGETSRYVLTPEEPLVTGSRYTLMIDGQRSDLPADSTGKTFTDLRLELKTSGEKPPPKPAKKPARKRRR